VNTHHLSAQSHSDDNGFIRVDETMIITGIRLRRDRNDKFFYPSTGGGDYRNSNGFSAGSDGGSTSSSDDDEEDDDIVNGGYILNRNEYTQKALEFAQKTNTGGFLDIINGSYFYRYEPSTQSVFIATLKGKIKSFYKWDGRENDFVIPLLKKEGLL
jgi:hypothetical protein